MNKFWACHESQIQFCWFLFSFVYLFFFINYTTCFVSCNIRNSRILSMLNDKFLQVIFVCGSLLFSIFVYIHFPCVQRAHREISEP